MREVHGTVTIAASPNRANVTEDEREHMLRTVSQVTTSRTFRHGPFTAFPQKHGSLKRFS